MINLFNREQRYRIGKLKDHIFLYDYASTKVYHARNEAFWITSERSYKLYCKSAKFTSTSSDDGRYQINSGIEVVLDERDKVDNYYLLKEIVSGKWIIGFETLEGEQFLMSPEYPALVSYTHTINDTDVSNNTTLYFNVFTNVPNCKCLTSLPFNQVMRGKECAYNVGRIKSLELASVNNVTITINDGTFTVNDKYSGSVCKISYTPKTLEYNEEYDGEKYTQTLSFDIPFEEYQHSFHYSLLEFLDNKYYAILTTTNNNYCLAGFPFGMIPSYNVATGENTNVVTITLSYSSSARGMATATSLDVTEGNGKIYIAAEQECVNDIYSTVLVEELNNDGTSNGYYCLEGFEADYASLNLLGTYDSIYTTKFGIKLYDNTVKCITEECSVEGIASTTTFNNAGEAKTYTVVTDCTLTPMPNDNCKLTYSDGKLTITNLQDEGNYTYSLLDGNGYVHTYYVTVQPLTEYLQYIEVTAKAQKITVTTEFTLDEIESKTVADTLILTPVENNQGWYVEIPSNSSTSVLVEHVITIEYSNGNSERITILQDHLYERFVNDGTQLCTGNDLWNYAHRYIGYTSDDINIDSGYVKLSLIQTNASLCVNADDYMKELQEEVCIDGYIYELNTYVLDADSDVTFNKAVKTDFTCDEATSLYERWVVNSDMVTCVDGIPYAYEVREISTDNTNWYPTDERRVSSTSVNSFVCMVEDNTSDGDDTEQPSSATITLYATSREIPYSGGYAYLQVDYINATTIHTPTTNAQWLSITQTQSGSTTTNGQPTTQVQYRFSADGTTADRNATVTFSCVGEDDITVTDSHFKVYQYGAITREVTLDISDGYVCDGTTMYYAIATEISYDNGVTWTRLDGYSKGDLYAENSVDCGYVDSGGDDTGTTTNPPTITTDTSLIDFPKSGATRYVTVTYTNVAEVLSPENSSNWCTISAETTQMTAPNTHVIKYKVVAEATTTARSGVIVFFASGLDGTFVNSSVTAKQSNTSYQTITLDIEEDYTCVGTSKYYTVAHQESNDNGNTWTTTSTELGDLYEENSTDCGYINTTISSIDVDTGQLGFTSNGGSSTVIVTYTNVNEIYDPVHADWIILTETDNEEGTDDEGNETKTVTYLVTVDSNTSTARESTITFSGMGYDGVDVTNDTLTVNQSASSSSTSGEYFGDCEDFTRVIPSSGRSITICYVFNDVCNKVTTKESSASWISFTNAKEIYSSDDESIGGNAYFDIEALDASDTEGREATITITAKDKCYNDVELTYLIKQVPHNNVLTTPYISIPAEYDNTQVFHEGATFECQIEYINMTSINQPTTDNSNIKISVVNVEESSDSIGNRTKSYTYRFEIEENVTSESVTFNVLFSAIGGNDKTYQTNYEILQIGKYGVAYVVNTYDITDTTTSTKINSMPSTKVYQLYIDGVLDWNIKNTYKFATTGAHTVTYYNLYDSDYNSGFTGCDSLIATKINKSKVNDSMFRNSTNLTSVTLPNYLTTIGNSSFSDSPSLTDIDIPDSVTSIGTHAFSYCNGFTSFDLPTNITSIPQYLFYRCENLTNIVIPSGVTVINAYSFAYCTKLASVSLPEGLQSIHQSVFSHTGLISIDLPSSLTKLGEIGYSDVFSDCTALTSIVLPSGVTTIGDSLFKGCTSLTAVTILGNITQVGNSAFRNCSSLGTIELPSSLLRIGTNVFQDSDNLNSIYCYATTAPTIQTDTFYGSASSGVLYYPSGSDYSTWLNALGDGWQGIEI